MQTLILKSFVLISWEKKEWKWERRQTTQFVRAKQTDTLRRSARKLTLTCHAATMRTTKCTNVDCTTISTTQFYDRHPCYFMVPCRFPSSSSSIQLKHTQTTSKLSGPCRKCHGRCPGVQSHGSASNPRCSSDRHQIHPCPGSIRPTFHWNET